MQNGFGFKDFMLLVMVFVLIIMTGMQMVQEDRRFRVVQDMKSAVQEQATQTGALRRAIQDGGIRATGPRPGEGQQAAARDESWARPGVPIAWQDGPAFVHDPRAFDDFAEGGELRETFEGRPAKITPYQYSDVYGRRVVDNVVVETLARYNFETLALEGVLAEAWQYDPDGMWLRVKIRDEACFSDGMPVTARDVQFSFDFIMDPQMDTERFRSVINMITRVDVISEKVCEFHFESPMFSNLSAATNSIWILPEHVYAGLTPAQFNSATGFLMGSGPYRLETLDINNQWAPPADIVLVRNENYYGARQGPDALRFRIIQNYTTSLTDFQNGGSHMMRATSEQFREMSEDERFVEANRMLAWSNMRGGYSFIVWNCAERNGRATPFADRRVRMAMTLLLDRERINRDFYMGLAAVATGPFPPGPQQNPAIEPWEFNEERARQLLAEAGWLDRNNNGILDNERGDEFRWEYTFSTGSPTTEKIGNYVVDQCRRVGIVCTVRKVDWSIMDSILDNRDFDGLTMAWSASAPESDPNQLWHSDSIQNRGDNFAQWNSPEADRLIVQGRATMDDAERMRVWHELHRVIHEEQPYTFLLEIPWIRFVDRDVQNVHTYPSGLAKEEWYFPGGSEAPMSGG